MCFSIVPTYTILGFYAKDVPISHLLLPTRDRQIQLLNYR